MLRETLLSGFKMKYMLWSIQKIKQFYIVNKILLDIANVFTWCSAQSIIPHFIRKKFCFFIIYCNPPLSTSL